ncbi:MULTISPECIES: hypothetical protein [Pseudoalteromonas]|jgi:antibiotic biosynthesis monooxygenase (ABM) superfamily enzyme|uniref:Antibiotic biosynthesis monooxygenase n=1 Tax=Pseudoalteromonas aliena SW19 TaxID=1314866 RepID=A0ABR9DXR6_9GAMM|nr:MULTISPECIES: hypothetical protein [Pseudoalteromonas]MBE0359137.1 hypothetical protein [Pseudoalteromonas aliena SW19]
MTITNNNKQVTVIVRHNVRPEKQAVFQCWLEGIEKACQLFSGFIGTDVIKPLDENKLHYICIFRFDNFLNLEQWMASNERAQWLAKCIEFSDIVPEYEHYQHHGMDILLGSSQNEAGQKMSPLKMILMTILGLSLPVHFIPGIVASFIDTSVVITLTSLTLIVPIMVLFIMPLLVKLFGRWLF